MTEVDSGLFISDLGLINVSKSSHVTSVYESKKIHTTVADSFSFEADVYQTNEYTLVSDFGEKEQVFKNKTKFGSVAFLKSDKKSSEGEVSYFISNQRNEDVLAYFNSPELNLGDSPFFAFSHQYDFEKDWDGGYLEISLDQGATYEQIPSSLFINEPYNTSLKISSNEIIAGKQAFSGSSAGFVRSVIDLREYANKSIYMRFVFGTDVNTNGEGWFIDEIQLVNAYPKQIKTMVFVDDKLGHISENEIVILPPVRQIAYLTTCTDEKSHNYGDTAQDCETCDDGTLNGDEEQIDCGGSLCEPCLCDLQPLDLSKIDIKVFLEGGLIKNALNGDVSVSMSSKLNENGYLPGDKPKVAFGTKTSGGQPYNTDIFQYEGLEGNHANFGQSCYSSSVIDWILVELRTGLDKSTSVVQFAALLHSDGQLQFFNSTVPDLVDGDSFYIILYHRNSLPAISDKIFVQNQEIAYDFTTNEGYTYGFTSNQKLMDSGVYALFSGNVSKNELNLGDVNSSDLAQFRNDFGKHDAYLDADFNLDSDVNSNDKSFLYANAGMSSFIVN